MLHTFHESFTLVICYAHNQNQEIRFHRGLPTLKLDFGRQLELKTRGTRLF